MRITGATTGMSIETMKGRVCIIAALRQEQEPQQRKPTACLTNSCFPCAAAVCGTVPRPTDPQKFLAQLPAELARLRDHGASLIEFKAEVCAFDRRYCTPEVWERV